MNFTANNSTILTLSGWLEKSHFTVHRMHNFLRNFAITKQKIASINSGKESNAGGRMTISYALVINQGIKPKAIPK
ncbi:unnamed protein product [marine sediment metagenome]|uniref:Uncharacterized protein n=1 Tax=marine sediment metagenome TaxID=412755 RepID=X1INV5_9ZZZZ